MFQEAELFKIIPESKQFHLKSKQRFAETTKLGVSAPARKTGRFFLTPLLRISYGNFSKAGLFFKK